MNGKIWWTFGTMKHPRVFGDQIPILINRQEQTKTLETSNLKGRHYCWWDTFPQQSTGIHEQSRGSLCPPKSLHCMAWFKKKELTGDYPWLGDSFRKNFWSEKVDRKVRLIFNSGFFNFIWSGDKICWIWAWWMTVEDHLPVSDWVKYQPSCNLSHAGNAGDKLIFDHENTCFTPPPPHPPMQPCTTSGGAWLSCTLWNFEPLGIPW